MGAVSISVVSAGLVKRAVAAGSEILVDIDASVTDVTGGGPGWSLHQGPYATVQ